MATAEHDEQPTPPADPVEPDRTPPAARARGWRAVARPRIVVPAGALLYLLGMTLPWFSTPAYDAGFGYSAPASTVNGFDAGMLVVAAVLLVVAAAVSLLPARTGPRLPFPRALVPAGLTSLSLLLTVPEWLTTFDRGFAAAGLLTVLSAAAACTVTVRAAAAEVRAAPGAEQPAAPDTLEPDAAQTGAAEPDAAEPQPTSGPAEPASSSGPDDEQPYQGPPPTRPLPAGNSTGDAATAEQRE